MCLACSRRSREASATGKKQATGKSQQGETVERSDKIRKVEVRQQWGRFGGFADHVRNVILTFNKISSSRTTRLTVGFAESANSYFACFRNVSATGFVACRPQPSGAGSASDKIPSVDAASPRDKKNRPRLPDSPARNRYEIGA